MTSKELTTIDLFKYLWKAIQDIFRYDTPSKVFFTNIMLFLLYVLLLIIIKKRKFLYQLIIVGIILKIYHWIVDGWKYNLKPKPNQKREVIR